MVYCAAFGCNNQAKNYEIFVFICTAAIQQPDSLLIYDV
jgi:hypothetical protein